MQVTFDRTGTRVAVVLSGLVVVVPKLTPLMTDVAGSGVALKEASAFSATYWLPASHSRRPVTYSDAQLENLRVKLQKTLENFELCGRPQDYPRIVELWSGAQLEVTAATSAKVYYRLSGAGLPSLQQLRLALQSMVLTSGTRTCRLRDFRLDGAARALEFTCVSTMCVNDVGQAIIRNQCRAPR